MNSSSRITARRFVSHIMGSMVMWPAQVVVRLSAAAVASVSVPRFCVSVDPVNAVPFPFAM